MLNCVRPSEFNFFSSQIQESKGYIRCSMRCHSPLHLHLSRWEESPVCTEDGDSGSSFRAPLTRPRHPHCDLHVLPKACCCVAAGSRVPDVWVRLATRSSQSLLGSTDWLKEFKLYKILQVPLFYYVQVFGFLVSQLPWPPSKDRPRTGLRAPWQDRRVRRRCPWLPEAVVVWRKKV